MKHLRTEKVTIARLTAGAEQDTTEPEVWNQIRRTDEQPMEMGTMENTLLRDQGIGTGLSVRVGGTGS